MSKFTNKSFLISFKHAIEGIIATFKSQRNFRIQLLIFVTVCVFSCYFKYTLVEFLLCFFSIALVLILEMINSCTEFTLDAVYKNKYSILVKLAKDISAGAVLMASANCFFINIAIFISKLYTYYATC